MAVNQVIYGEETLIDLTNDTVTPSALAEGETAHNAAGEEIVGTLKVLDEIVTTEGDGSAYTATVRGITSLTPGVNFIMIPHVVSASTNPTLNVNGLGAKRIRQPLTNNTSATTVGASDNWLVANKPVRVMYDGTYWKTVELARASATGLYGTVPVANGGTGSTTPEDAITALGVDKLVKKNTCPRNLLDNSDFTNPVNQRGKAEYHGTTGYTIDRWRVPAKTKVEVLDSYIRLTCTAETTANGFTHRFEKPLSVGAVFTAAMMETNGTLHVGTVTVPSSSYATAFRLDNGIYLRVDTAQLSVMLPGGQTIDLVWIALYEGEYTAETLPDYQPKGYAVELAQCYRHFINVSGTKLAYGYVDNNPKFTVALPVSSNLRLTSPTLTIDGNITILVNGTHYSNFTPVDGTVTFNNSVLTFEISRSGGDGVIKNAEFCAYWTGNTTISAEL